MPKLFSYGTLQQENVQMATFGRLLTGQKDRLIGYQLGEIEITDPDVLAKSGKQFHPMLIKTGNPDDSVAGVVFDVTDTELAQADSYEVEAYKRALANFASGETAWIYADARDYLIKREPPEELQGLMTFEGNIFDMSESYQN